MPFLLIYGGGLKPNKKVEDNLFDPALQGRVEREDAQLRDGLAQDSVAIRGEVGPGSDEFAVCDVAPNEEATDSGGFVESLKKQKHWIAAGALAVGSTVASVANTGWHELAGRVTEVAPWVAPGIAASEVAWAGGAAMALAAAGKKVRNVLRVRREFAHIEEDVATASGPALSESPLFRAGLAVNTAGAVGTFGVITAGVLKMPAESWGLLSIGAVDLAGTIAARAAIWRAAQPRTSVSEKEGVL